MATARNAITRGGRAGFYLPWMTFPVGDQRKTGLLFPSIGQIPGVAWISLSPSISIWRPATRCHYSPYRRAGAAQANGRWLMTPSVTGMLPDYRPMTSTVTTFPMPTANAGPWRYDRGWWPKLAFLTQPGQRSDTSGLRQRHLSSQRQTALLQLGQITTWVRGGGFTTGPAVPEPGG